MNKQYLGDSVYAEFDDLTGSITLTTDNGQGPTNTIVLEPDVLASLAIFHKSELAKIEYANRKSAEIKRIGSLLDRECRCHISPPCDFCTSLNEAEVGIYANEGRDSLYRFLHAELENLQP